MGVMIAPPRLVLEVVPPERPFGYAALRRGDPAGWDLLGTVPVPLRHAVRDGVADLAAGHRAQGAAALKVCFPMGQGGRTPFERLRFIRTLADYPAMLVSCEYGHAFNRRFHAAHVETGAFSACQPEGLAPAFVEAGLVDPRGWIGVFAVAPFVILADHRRLDGRPAPRRWADLLDPGFRDQVVLSGWLRPGDARPSQLNLFFLLSVARLFGLDGLARLAANVPALMHSAQMPRFAGSDASPGGVCVLPWSLAALCPRRAETEVIWPEEGALAFPLWLTVKSAERDRLRLLTDHFHGPGLAAVLNANRYPALCPGPAPALPPGARLWWPGWDVLRHRSTPTLVKTARRTFLDVWAARRCA